MQNRFCQLLMTLALIVTIGAHWALLQSVAWVGMLATNARAYSLTEAITRTFDGQHPCRLCHVIAVGKQTEQKQPVPNIETKIDFWLTLAAGRLILPAPPHYPRSVSVYSPLRLDSPPTPPPRLT